MHSINSQADVAAVGGGGGGDGSTLPKTSGNQRGCGNNRSEIDRVGASESPFFTLLPNLSFFSTLPPTRPETTDGVMRKWAEGERGLAEETAFSSLSGRNYPIFCLGCYF